MKDPSGGNTEEEDEDDEPQVECSLFSCLKPLLTWSFALIMIGSLSVDFIHEGMFAVIPDFLDRTRNETGKQWPLFLSQSYYSDFMVYSAIKCAADVLGMLLGMEISKLLSKEPHSADPWVCAIGLFAFTPIFSLFLIFIKDGIVLPCVFLFISGVFLSLNQALSGDMMLSVIRPKFYTIAGQLQAFLTRLIAGVGAPFIIEYISVKIQESNSEKTSFECMQFALMFLTVVAVIGGTCFLCLNLSFKKDREAADKNATPRQSDVEKSLFTVQRGIERYRGQRIEREELEVGEGGKKGLGSWEKSSPLPHLPQLSPPPTLTSLTPPATL
ncbi:protein spinster homolog 1-like [Xenopus tropicalis]|uniref:Protein spinster homolog 1-like n=1 Tax=Xenopus tropicalis TaxID=8364 RepID=A0A8J1JTP6_XENTR|nr:protein spinster homolog 1-like [Xenopus tropicalis]XP_031761263.1 protein spinster homolog 1-like [Xenopus tropicalis]